MLVYLDGAQNRKRQPERELRARGDGALHARRRPLHRARRQGSRARVHRLEPRPRHRRVSCSAAALHDAGEKTVLGRTGPLRRRRRARPPARAAARPPSSSRQAVARVRVARARCRARCSASRRLPRPGYDIKVALRALLPSAMRSGRPSNRGVLVKSPVELVVGTLRQLDVAPGDAMPFAVVAAGMGQNLFSPPNVKGWPGGEAWINSEHAARAQAVPRAARARWTTRRRAMMAAPTADAAAGARAARAAGRRRTTDEDARRASRFARAIDRGVAQPAFRRRAWVARMPGDTPTAKHAVRRRRCCCRSSRRPRKRPPIRPTPMRSRSCARRCSTRRTSSNEDATMDRRIVPARLRRAARSRALGMPASVAFAAAPDARATTASSSCWSSSRAATTASTRSCPIADPGLLRAAAEARDRARPASCSCPIARACIRRSRRSCRCGSDGSLAVLQGVGYPDPNLSHFRSIEIWDTRAQERDVSRGRLAHARVRDAPGAGVVRRRRRRSSAATSSVRSPAAARARSRSPTPSSSCAARASRSPRRTRRNKALAHILKVEGDIVQAASHLVGGARRSRPTFPHGRVRQRDPHRVPDHRQPAGVAVVRVTLSGFDTHANQPATHARLLGRARATASSRCRRR